MPFGDSKAGTGRVPFAGSPGYALQFGDGSGPAWPVLTQGFLGGLVRGSELRKLGFDGAAGAPVFDAKGTLVGITLASVDGDVTWRPLPSTAPSQAPAPAPAGPALVAPDQVYEAGLRRALQVLVDAPR
jgi:hypothetical protein